MFIIEDAKEKLKELNAKKDELTDPEFQRLSEISSQLEKANKEKKVMRKFKELFTYLLRKVKSSQKLLMKFRKSKVLKIISYWQHVLNYIFYIVFILNIFITGLGIAGSENIKAGNENVKA